MKDLTEIRDLLLAGRYVTLKNDSKNWTTYFMYKRRLAYWKNKLPALIDMDMMKKRFISEHIRYSVYANEVEDLAELGFDKIAIEIDYTTIKENIEKELSQVKLESI